MTMTRKDAIKTLRELWRETNNPWYEEVYNMAIEALSAEAVQGEWTYLSGSKGSYMTISCPICGSTFNGVPEWKYHYCPSCGADMRGKEE